MKFLLATIALATGVSARLRPTDETSGIDTSIFRYLQINEQCVCQSDYDCHPTCIKEPYASTGVCGNTGNPTPNPPTPSPPTPAQPTIKPPCPCDNPKRIPTRCEVLILITMMDTAVSVSHRLAPQWLRASFHDAGTFNQKVPEGGANGCLMNFGPMLGAAENAFLDVPIDTLRVIKENWENLAATCIKVSSADIIQFAGLFGAVRQKDPNPGILDQGKISQLLAFEWGRSDEVSCNAIWTLNLPGFDLGTDPDDIPLRCLNAGGEIKNKMMMRNGFTALEATALIGAHTIGQTRNIFGVGLAGPWVINGDDDATPNGPVFDNAYHFFLDDTIVANTVAQFAANQDPFDLDLETWFRDSGNDLNHLDTDVVLAFPTQDVATHPDFHEFTEDFAASNQLFLDAFFAALDKMSKLGVEDILFAPTECDPCTEGDEGITIDTVTTLIKSLGNAFAVAEGKLDEKQEAREEERKRLTTPGLSKNEMNETDIVSPEKTP